MAAHTFSWRVRVQFDRSTAAGVLLIELPCDPDSGVLASDLLAATARKALNLMPALECEKVRTRRSQAYGGPAGVPARCSRPLLPCRRQRCQSLSTLSACLPSCLQLLRTHDFTSVEDAAADGIALVLRHSSERPDGARVSIKDDARLSSDSLVERGGVHAVVVLNPAVKEEVSPYLGAQVGTQGSARVEALERCCTTARDLADPSHPRLTCSALALQSALARQPNCPPTCLPACLTSRSQTGPRPRRRPSCGRHQLGKAAAPQTL